MGPPIDTGERGLHDRPTSLREILQDQIDDIAAPYDAAVLAYGLCGGAAARLVANELPVVLPRVHDCITMFHGDRREYQVQINANSGTYWYVQDYLERGTHDGMHAGVGASTDEAIAATRQEYVEKYREDNAEYLMEVLGAWRDHYDRAASEPRRPMVSVPTDERHADHHGSSVLAWVGDSVGASCTAILT